MSFINWRLGLLGFILCAGCNPAAPPKPATSPAAAPTNPVASATMPPHPETGIGIADALGGLPAESWSAIFMGGNQVGYEHTQVRPLREAQRDLVEIVQTHRFSVLRFGQRSELGIEQKSVETPTGQLLRFTTRQELGPAPIETSGRVENGNLLIEVATTGKTTPTSIPWSAEFGGFFGVEQSLVRQPLKSGERRTLRLLDPILNQAVVWQLAAGLIESTRLLEGSRDLLKIEATVLYPGGQTMNAVAWTDSQGLVLKNRLAGAQEVYRTTKEVALQGAANAPTTKPFDLGFSSTVRLDRPLANAHQTRRVRYKVQLTKDAEAGGELSKTFLAGPTQQIEPVDSHAAIITVRTLRPGAKPDGASPADEPTDADRQPNNMIQSEHESIARMAKEAAGDETDPVKMTMLLESHVHRAIRKVNFTTAFASAADVAASREGDCTEHAVLLAALARAKGIPARTAVGLVYADQLQGFGFHMWTEMFLNGQWIPLDGTLGQGGIGAAHLKLSHSNLAGGEGFASFLPVINVMGRLKIEVLEAE